MPALFVALAAGAVATTTLTQGSAHAGPRTSTPSLHQVIRSLPAVPALTSVADIHAELNRRRAEKQLPELVFDDWMLSPTAQKWAEVMAGKGHVLHDPDLLGDYASGWTTISESVAAGGSADAALATVLANERQAEQVFNPATTTAGVGLTTVGAETYLVVRFVG